MTIDELTRLVEASPGGAEVLKTLDLYRKGIAMTLRIIAAAVLCWLLLVASSCAGYYAALTAKEKEHFREMEREFPGLVVKAEEYAQRAQDAAARAERGAARATGEDVPLAEECLAKTLSISRSLTRSYDSLYRGYLRGLPYHYPTRVKRYTSAYRLVQAMSALADRVDQVADCEPEALQTDPPPLPELEVSD